MDFSFLPTELADILNNKFADKIYEIRCRINFPFILNYDNKRVFLGKNGPTIFKQDAIICSQSHIDDIINNVTENSLYAFNETIKHCFLTYNNSVRIGIAGECVYDNDKIVTIKNITSLNIRIPHEIDNCSKDIFDKIFLNSIENTLIISPPSYGKTTILKDLALKINNNYNKSILIIDERGEFSNVKGINIDIIKFGDKYHSFLEGVRSLSPDIAIMDELSTESDWFAAKTASNSGVNIIASCHAKNINDLINKNFFINNLFYYYVFLSSENIKGQVNVILNNKLEEI